MRVWIFITLFISIGVANHISWMGDYNKALEIAKKEHKNMMVLLVKNNCKACNDFIVKYFMNRDYIDALNREFISVVVTYEGRTSYPIELLYSTTFPTLFFIDSKNENFLEKPIYFILNKRYDK